MAPNHGGDPLRSIFGPVGSHWVQKMDQNRKKLSCIKIRIFDYPAVIDFSLKNGSYGCSAKSQWWPRRVHLGSNGVPLGPKRSQNSQNLPCPKIRIFDRSSIVLKKKGSYGYGAKSRRRPSRVHLWANRVPLGPKNGSKPLIITMPQYSHFWLPAVIDFSQKKEVTVMAPNHGGDPLGSILGPMGSHWVKKMGQNRQNLLCPKIRIFDHPAVIDLSKKMVVPFYGAKSRWRPSRVHLGANRVPLGPKYGSKPLRITMPQNSNFWLPLGHRFFT